MLSPETVHWHTFSSQSRMAAETEFKTLQNTQNFLLINLLYLSTITNLYKLYTLILLLELEFLCWLVPIKKKEFLCWLVNKLLIEGHWLSVWFGIIGWAIILRIFGTLSCYVWFGHCGMNIRFPGRIIYQLLNQLSPHIWGCGKSWNKIDRVVCWIIVWLVSGMGFY